MYENSNCSIFLSMFGVHALKNFRHSRGYKLISRFNLVNWQWSRLFFHLSLMVIHLCFFMSCLTMLLNFKNWLCFFLLLHFKISLYIWCMDPLHLYIYYKHWILVHDLHGHFLNDTFKRAKFFSLMNSNFYIFLQVYYFLCIV